MVVQPLRGFMHRKNRDLTIDAICLSCCVLVSVAWKPMHLIKAEAKHVCGATACDVSGLSTGFRPRRFRFVLVVTDLAQS